ncbi:MAG: AbrB/MazE/SpoVT family DNA-binding domain-containing protein [Magnetococcales bacterium]|nr:AbrB/MazE/SpoVT family DNA-binding domain-containing protein [Magnetococcales bacterium]
MPIAKLNPWGGVTIPQEIRDQLNLRPGDRLAFRISVVPYINLRILRSACY